MRNLVLAAAVLAAACSHGALGGAPAPTQAAEEIIALDLSRGPPTVMVAIGDGAPAPAIFDTGAQGAVIDIERARALGLPDQGPQQVGSPIGGEPLIGFRTTIERANIGGVAVAPFSAAAIPIRAGLVIGPSVFSGKLVTIDFAASQIRLSDRSEAPSGVPSTYADDGLPAVSGQIGDRSIVAHLDSGAPGGLTLPLSMAETLPLAAPLREVGRARFVDAERVIHAAPLRGEVRIGAVVLQDPMVEFIEGAPYANVGIRLLTRMAVTIDPDGRRVWAAPAGE